jgi:uncharacterized protein (TIGR03083 family)
VAEQPPIETIVRESNRVSRSEVQVWVAELRAGGDAAWTAPTMCQGWAAKDVVGHVAQAIWFFNAVIHATFDGQPAPSGEHAHMQAAIDQLLAQPRDTVLTALAERNEAFAEYLDSLDVAAMPTPIDLGFMVLPIWQIALVRLNEIILHRWDTRAAQRPGLPVDSDGVPLALDMSLGGAQIMATHGEKRDGTWQLDLTGPGGGPVTLRVQGETVTAQRVPAAAPDVRLGLPSEALLRLFWGRLDLPAALASGQVSLDGDRAKALALQRLFPGA